MATYAVRFYIYYLDGGIAYDEDEWHEVHSERELRKSEIIAQMSLHGGMERPGYQYVKMILQFHPDDGHDTERINYYDIDTEAQYREAVDIYRREARLPCLGLVFKKGIEKA